MQAKLTKDEIINESDQNVLKDIIKNSDDFNIRALACRNPNLSDEAFLEKIALNDTYESVRISCLKNPNLSDEKLFIDVGLNDSHHSVRLEAISHITDENTLVNIFHTDSVGYLRRKACKQLKNTNPDSIYLAGENVIANIEDEDLLVELGKKSLRKKSRICAINHLNNELALYKIVLHENDSEIACKAVENIKNEELLADIACNEIYWQVRCEALRNPNLKNCSILAEMAFDEDNSEIRKSAVLNPNFCDKKLLEKIAEDDNDFNVRMAAKEKTNSN